LSPRWPPGRAGSTWRQNSRCPTPPRAAGSVRLYQGDVVLDLAEPERVIERTEGVTASFLKELIRKAALLACEDGTGSAAADGGRAATQTAQAAPIRVTDDHMTAALDQLLDTKSQLTRVLLGGGQPGDALPGEAPHGQARGGDRRAQRPSR
jgi:hypothetical protein